MAWMLIVGLVSLGGLGLIGLFALIEVLKEQGWLGETTWSPGADWQPVLRGNTEQDALYDDDVGGWLMVPGLGDVAVMLAVLGGLVVLIGGIALAACWWDDRRQARDRAHLDETWLGGASFVATPTTLTMMMGGWSDACHVLACGWHSRW